MKKLMLLLLFTFFASTVQAIPLSVVNVSAPPINCIFDPSCTIVVNDTTAPITLPGSTGQGFLQSRTYRGAPGSPAAGLYAYLYRVDLRNIAGLTNITCVNSVTINFGPVVSTLDYNGDHTTGDQVFVITGGGIGSIGIASANQVGGLVTFNFSSPVCDGSSPSSGQSSFFWGLVSARQPHFVSATVNKSSGPAQHVLARAPFYFSRGVVRFGRRQHCF
jgi:hypothetical protein